MNIELTSFLLIAFLLAVSPGPSVLYVIAYSLRYGALAGITFTIGVNAGSIVLVLISAFSLTALLSQYPGAIGFIQMTGGIYVMYLAIQLWPDRCENQSVNENLTGVSRISLLISGFMSSILNPKDILFYTAFIPSFMADDPGSEEYRSGFLTLAFLYTGIGLVTKSIFCLFSGYIKQMLNYNSASYLNYLSSVVLFAVGVYVFTHSLFQFSK